MATREQIWNTYVAETIQALAPILKKGGYILDNEQPHVVGERFLMQAVTTTSGKKLILLGTRIADRKRVVIKVSNEKAGISELKEERKVRHALKAIRFAYRTFNSPKELFWGKKKGYAMFIQEFLPNSPTFLERPVKEQFDLALSAFKGQEGAHATTYAHQRFARRYFNEKKAGDYITSFEGFVQYAEQNRIAEDLFKLLQVTLMYLKENKTDIERYQGFLTHTDFVPHNFRVIDDSIYLLDHSSIRFGNKHEGWARFLNFMTLYNPDLEEGFALYMRENRSLEERHSLKLMRLYRLGEIIYYYITAEERSSGDLKMLNHERIYFWGCVLKRILHDEKLRTNEREAYIKKRDALRSPEEKMRQKGLH